MEQSGWIVVAHAYGPAALHEQTLVLRAMGIPHRLEHISGGVILCVPAEFAERALRELGEYAGEAARRRPPEELPPIPRGALPSAAVYIAVLIAVYVLERSHAFGLDWWGRGLSHAERIYDGEWWRAITALTLHTDVPHLAGNIVFGAIFGVLFAQQVGSGVAWSCALLSGILGNLANAWVTGADHRSVGASTAVFGVLGCMVIYEWRRRTRLKVRLPRRLAPPLLGLVLLGWFGVGGERTDVGAHVWGMITGGVIGGAIGAALSLRRNSAPWPAGVQLAYAAAALLTIAGAWTLALG